MASACRITGLTVRERGDRMNNHDTGRPLADFSEVCPWTVAQVLDADFWPAA
jgi:hypothetical protein